MEYKKLQTIQHSQPLLSILYLRHNTGASGFPKDEEFLVMLYGFLTQAILALIDISLPGLILRKPKLKKYHELSKFC